MTKKTTPIIKGKNETYSNLLQFEIRSLLDALSAISPYFATHPIQKKVESQKRDKAGQITPHITGESLWDLSFDTREQLNWQFINNVKDGPYDDSNDGSQEELEICAAKRSSEQTLVLGYDMIQETLANMELRAYAEYQRPRDISPYQEAIDCLRQDLLCHWFEPDVKSSSSNKHYSDNVIPFPYCDQ